MKIIYVRPAGAARGRLRIGVDCDGEKQDFSLSESEYSAVGSPLSGDIIDADIRERMAEFDLHFRARKKALGILSYADNSEISLIRKLRTAGFSEKLSRTVAEEMVMRGYINENRQLKHLISTEVRLHMTGPKKLIPKLMAKGYKRSDIDIALDELTECGEVDFAEAKARLLMGLRREDTELIKKTLYKNGY